MIPEQKLADLTGFAFSIVPEMDHLYVVDSTLFDGLPIRRECMGWADACGYVRQPIVDRLESRWQGPAPVICLFENDIRQEYGDDFEAGLLEVMTHELAHCVPVPPPLETDWDDLDRVRKFQLEKMEQAIQPTPELAKSDRKGHGKDFVRYLAHVWFRAHVQGYSIAPYRLLAGADVLTQLPHFVCALMPELCALEGATFAEIAATDPPQAFSQMWADEVLLYRGES